LRESGISESADETIVEDDLEQEAND